MKTAKDMTVVSAAAGTGKTTRLVQEYLKLLKENIPPSQIIAITFTRKAAAELVEKVSICLRHKLKESIPEGFDAEFNKCFSEYVPEDEALIRAALSGLPNAPAGTIDSFVQRLLAEFALDARLPTDDRGNGAWLDLPIGQGNVREVVEAAVRAEIDPDDGNVPPEAIELLKHMGLQELLKKVSATILTLSAEETREYSGFAGSLELVELALQKCSQVLPEAIKEVPGIFKIKAAAVMDWVEPVQQWSEGGMKGPVPSEVLPWYAALETDSKAKERLTFSSIVGRPEHAIDFGVAILPLDKFLRLNAGGMSTGDLRDCDQIRKSIVALARRSRVRAYRMAAAAGALDHDLLTEVAIDLCSRSDRSDRLCTRFKALLVDEVQDSSPRQFRLYEALQQLPGPDRPLRTFFVGDSRQSIYLFRGAEPAGLTELKKLAVAGGKHENLAENFRSTPSMVKAQKELFGRAISGTEELNGLPGVSTIDDIKHSEERVEHELPPDSPYLEPVVMVTLTPKEKGQGKWSATDFNDAAIDIFAERIRHAWENEGRTHDTAAVLTTGWGKAIHARNRLRALLRDAGAGDAFLDGNSDLLNGQVATDVRTIVSALWDRTDDVAWAGLWRHPMVGMSDGALAAMHQGVGLLKAEGAVRGLARALSADALSPDVYDEKDIATFARVKPALERAAGSIGRIPTSEVIETLAATLHWRTIILRGPGDMDSVGELEVILDWIRQAEAETVDPEAVVNLLDPSQSDEVPRVELYRGEKSVSCTTIFQAKGLKYDHVLVTSIGSFSGKGAKPASKALVGGIEKTLLGTEIDPDRALKPVADPVSKLALSIGEIRRREEALRMVYVAVTRAVRSVTFAVGSKSPGVHSALSELWTAEPPLSGVKLLEIEAPAKIDTTIRSYTRATGPFGVEPHEPAGWVSVSPSQAGAAWKDLNPDAHKNLVDTILGRVAIKYGGEPIHPPAPAGLPENVAVTDDAWGTLVHAWMEFGGLTAGPGLAAADKFLKEQYGIVDKGLAAWLAGLIARLEETQPELLATLRSPEATLHFELPFAGAVQDMPGSPWFHAGRMDLMVAWPDGRAWVIDFKAGRRNAVAGGDLKKGAGLDEYIPQLEAYRGALTSAGWNIEKVGILFVRSGAWVSW